MTRCSEQLHIQANPGSQAELFQVLFAGTGLDLETYR